MKSERTKPLDKYILYTVGITLIGLLFLFLVALFRATDNPSRALIGMINVFLGVMLFLYIRIFMKFIKEGRK